MRNAPYSMAFRLLSMILFVPVMIIFLYFIDITLNGTHTGYILQLDRSSSALMMPNQKLILGVYEKRNENSGHDHEIREGIYKIISYTVCEHCKRYGG